MEDKSHDEYTIVLSSYDTEILTRAMADAAKEKPAPRKIQGVELKKKNHEELSGNSGHTEWI
jgi:hypothetical protein